MGYKSKPYLLMTGTILPVNCPSLISFSHQERHAMYLAAFKYYVEKLKSGSAYAGVVFCENSNCALDEFIEYAKDMSNVEVISAPPELFPSYLGKNNDFNIIDYAIGHSALLSTNESCFFKVTGRYYIENVDDLICDINSESDDIDFFCDLKDFQLLPLCGPKWRIWDADTRYFFSSRNFWIENFYEYYKKHPKCIPVERVAWGISMMNLRNRACRFRFKREAYLNGDYYTSQNAEYVKFLGLHIRPETYFKIRVARWRIETIARHVLPNFWF